MSAHTKNMKLPERSFLRTALKELAASGVIDSELNQAIAEASRK